MMTGPADPTVETTPATPTESAEKPAAISALEFAPDEVEESENQLDDPDAALAQEFFTSQTPPTPQASVPDPTVTPPVVVSSDPALQTPPALAVPQAPPAQAPVVPLVPAAATAPAQPQAAQPPSVSTDPQPTMPQASSPSAPEEAFRVLSDTITAQRPAIIEAVAAGQYQLTNEELVLVATEPEKVLPQLMARVHVNAVQGVLTHVAQQLPAVVNGMMRAQQVQADLENKFYSAWPQLDRTKHDATVRHLAATYRQMNPNASFEEITRVVGAQAAFAAGLVPQGVAPQAAAPAAQPRQVPFQPAAAARTAAVPARQELGTWEKMAMIMAADDAGHIDSA